MNARQMGYRDGVRGTYSNPYKVGTENWALYEEGYAEGAHMVARYG